MFQRNESKHCGASKDITLMWLVRPKHNEYKVTYHSVNSLLCLRFVAWESCKSPVWFEVIFTTSPQCVGKQVHGKKTIHAGLPVEPVSSISIIFFYLLSFDPPGTSNLRTTMCFFVLSVTIQLLCVCVCLGVRVLNHFAASAFI